MHTIKRLVASLSTLLALIVGGGLLVAVAVAGTGPEVRASGTADHGDGTTSFSDQVGVLLILGATARSGR